MWAGVRVSADLRLLPCLARVGLSVPIQHIDFITAFLWAGGGSSLLLKLGQPSALPSSLRFPRYRDISSNQPNQRLTEQELSASTRSQFTTL